MYLLFLSHLIHRGSASVVQGSGMAGLSNDSGEEHESRGEKL